ncbi:hypothetical protein MVEN_01736600 [Mycena venus]|uniref:Protein kinase domain-containing protein n=1 Tax=Mycena venus TaxID=2733690 RepID=A0A8H7CP37_9AGAR|nr:hypothetical protein MVEN_01736600 [Mycena venus]
MSTSPLPHQPDVLLTLSTMSNVGTAAYMAPEIFLVLEILTSEPPKRRPSRPIVTIKDLAELRPKRTDYDVQVVKHETWDVLDQCWTFQPQERPPIFQVLRELDSSFQPPKSYGAPGILRHRIPDIGMSDL